MRVDGRDRTGESHLGHQGHNLARQTNSRLKHQDELAVGGARVANGVLDRKCREVTEPWAGFEPATCGVEAVRFAHYTSFSPGGSKLDPVCEYFPWESNPQSRFRPQGLNLLRFPISPGKQSGSGRGSKPLTSFATRVSSLRVETSRTATGLELPNRESPEWDSNPQLFAYKANASAVGASGARAHRVLAERMRVEAAHFVRYTSSVPAGQNSPRGMSTFRGSRTHKSCDHRV